MKFLGFATCAILALSILPASSQDYSGGSLVVGPDNDGTYYYEPGSGTINFSGSLALPEGEFTLFIDNPTLTLQQLNTLFPNGPGEGSVYMVNEADGTESLLGWEQSTGWQFPQAVPEPGTWLLLALAATALLVRHKLRRVRGG